MKKKITAVEMEPAGWLQFRQNTTKSALVVEVAGKQIGFTSWDRESGRIRQSGGILDLTPQTTQSNSN